MLGVLLGLDFVWALFAPLEASSPLAVPSPAPESFFFHLAVIVYEQFGMVALCYGIFSYTLVRERIVIVADMDMLGIGHTAARIKA